MVLRCYRLPLACVPYLRTLLPPPCVADRLLRTKSAPWTRRTRLFWRTARADGLHRRRFVRKTRALKTNATFVRAKERLPLRSLPFLSSYYLNANIAAYLALVLCCHAPPRTCRRTFLLPRYAWFCYCLSQFSYLLTINITLYL